MCLKSASSKLRDPRNVAFHCQDQPTTTPTGLSFGLAVKLVTSDGHDWPRRLAITHPQMDRAFETEPGPLA